MDAKKDPTGITILVVDPQHAVYRCLMAMAEHLGHKALGAQNGAQALDCARQYPDLIHVLLTKPQLPDISGPSLANTLRDIKPELRALYMAGYAHNVLDAQHQSALLLQMPFTLDTLQQAIEYTLGS